MNGYVPYKYVCEMQGPRFKFSKTHGQDSFSTVPKATLCWRLNPISPKLPTRKTLSHIHALHFLSSPLLSPRSFLETQFTQNMKDDKKETCKEDQLPSLCILSMFLSIAMIKVVSPLVSISWKFKNSMSRAAKMILF